MSIPRKRDMMEACRATIPCMDDAQLLKLGIVMLDIMNEMAEQGKVDVCDGCYYNSNGEDRDLLPCRGCHIGDKHTTTLDEEDEAERLDW